MMERLARSSYKPRIACQHQELGRSEEGFFRKPFRESVALPPSFCTSSFQNCETINFCHSSLTVCGATLLQPRGN